MKIFLVSVYIVLTTSVLVVAQPNLPPPDPDVVPITGLEYLLIGGGAYGIYRLSKKKNSKNKEA
jgi:hypothetical protein